MAFVCRGYTQRYRTGHGDGDWDLVATGTIFYLEMTNKDVFGFTTLTMHVFWLIQLEDGFRVQSSTLMSLCCT